MTGGESVQLALNSIGGESALDQIRALGKGGTQVTFGGMSREPVRFPTRELIFKEVRLAGFGGINGIVKMDRMRAKRS